MNDLIDNFNRVHFIETICDFKALKIAKYLKTIFTPCIVFKLIWKLP